MSDTVVAIVSAFFIIGITVGIVAVIAVSVLRGDRRGGPDEPQDHEPAEPGGPPEAGWHDAGPDGDPAGPDGDPAGPGDRPAGPDDHSRWPGNVDNDFRNG
jgi:hypothetical protein